MGSSPPPPPLTIVGFASTASWRHALRAARELRGFGATFVVTDTWPSSLRLAEADISGVYVIATRSGEVDVLVQGRRTGGIAPRMVATRYWEERIFAHALEIGAPIPGCVPNRQPNESQGEMAVVTENHNAQNAPPGHAGRIRALSVRRPYANLIMSGHKRIENRSWGTEYRGVTAIHAGQKWEATGAALAHTFGAKGFAASANCPTGYLGTARLEDVHPAEGCRDRECEFWGVIEPGMFHWVFIDPAPFAVPIPGPGRLSLYLAPDSVRPAPRPA